MTQRTHTVEHRVLEVLRDGLEMSVDVDTDVIESGVLDSLRFVDLLVGLEEEFSIRIEVPEIEVDDFRSARAIADYLGRSHGLS